MEADLTGGRRRRAIPSLFADLPDILADERLDILVETEGFRLERIVSRGHATPPGEWYDQATHEWVLLLRGSAGLRFEGEETVVVMRPGDHVTIPARRRHRVEWTDPAEPTVWLALHYGDASGDLEPPGP